MRRETVFFRHKLLQKDVGPDMFTQTPGGENREDQNIKFYILKHA
jgi:hypothetical protein